MKKSIKIKEYKRAIEAFKNGNALFGICSELGHVFGIWSATLQLKEMFPEIFSLEPAIKYNYMYWFPLTPEGNKKRVKLLEQAIKLVI